MTITRRKFLELLKAPGIALVCSALPLTLETEGRSFPRFSVPLAHASDDDDGDDDGGGGGGGDNSGPGNQNDDRDDDDDDDDDGGRNRGRGGDDDSRGSGSRGRSGNGGSSGGSRRLGSQYNLTIRYNNGWFEQIRNGRYVFKDPKGRTVANRLARMEDVARMRAAVGK